MKTLIFGGSGFVGSFMHSRSPNWSDTNVVGSDVDIRDKKAVKTLIKHINPDNIVNLASITTVKETTQSPKDAYDISFYGTLNILEALKECRFRGTFLYISSSEVYGYPTASELPLSENSLIRPMSPYSVGKIAAEYLCLYWQTVSNFKIMVARPFTHIGPGQSDRFSIASFAKQTSEIIRSKKDSVIKVGDLNTTRDFTDVRDIVDAYWLLLEFGTSGETYNICSGTERKVSRMLDFLICLSNKDIKIKEDPNRLRNFEQKRIFGNAEKLYKATGWKPKINYQKTLEDMLNYCLYKE